MAEDQITIELLKCLGPGALGYLLKRFPDIETLWRFLQRDNVIELLDQISIKTFPVSRNEELFERSTADFPDLPHPTTEILEQRKGKYNVDFIHGYWYQSTEIGYSIIYPLKQQCVVKFRTNEYTTGADIEHKDISKTVDNSSGYYVGYLRSWTEDRLIRKLLILKLQTQMGKYLVQNKTKNVTILTNPSKNTFRIMDRHGFEKTDVTSQKKRTIHFIDRNIIVKKGKGLVY